MCAMTYETTLRERRQKRFARHPEGWRVYSSSVNIDNSQMAPPPLPRHLPGAPEGSGFDVHASLRLPEPIMVTDPAGFPADTMLAAHQMAGGTAAGRPYDAQRVVSLLQSFEADVAEPPDVQQANLERLMDAINDGLSDEMRVFLPG